MTLSIYEILVPTLMRGRPVHLRHHRVWDKFVRDVTGGLTITHPAKGQWVDPATKVLFEERVIPVRIACTAEQIDTIIDFTLTHYDQLAVMAYLISEKVILKYRKEKKK